MSLMCQSTTNRTMIWLSICLFLAVFANASSETPAEPHVTNPPLRDGDQCDVDSFNQVVCEKDRLIFCSPTNEITSSPCSIRGRPAFCNCEKTGCVARKPSCGGDNGGCSTPNTKLPDNLDCHKFSFCNEQKQKLILQCPGDLVYDPNTQKCRDRRSTRCAKLVCPKQSDSLKLIPFPQARNYYVLCYKGITDVRKCTDEYYAIQRNSYTCQFDCNLVKESGSFRDTNIERCESGFYYGCEKRGGNYITTTVKCPEGKYFDEKLNICTTTNTCRESTNPPAPTPQQ